MAHMMWLDQILGPSVGLSGWQQTARAVIIFSYGIAVFRIFGRRIFAKWSALDIVVAIVVGSNLSRALTGPIALGPALVATSALVLLHWTIAHAAARSRLVSRIVEGGPVVLVREGRVLTEALRRNAISEADLAEAVRRAGLTGAGSATLVVQEPSGRLSVLTDRREGSRSP